MPVWSILIILLMAIYPSTGMNFLLYGVNEAEGFNLKRDVYMRVANVLRLLRDPSRLSEDFENRFLIDHPKTNWTLVLPPWDPCWHWRVAASSHNAKYPLSSQPDLAGLPWSQFFDIASLSKFVPVMDFSEFEQTVSHMKNMEANAEIVIDQAYFLVRLPLDETEGSKITKKVNYCSEKARKYRRDQPSSMKVRRYDCISGSLEPIHLAPFLINVTLNGTQDIIVYLDSAQSIIHGHWSEWSEQYWTARRSMIFATKLRQIGDEFRRTQLASEDASDQTVPPSDWLQPSWPLAPAVGGRYIAVHWRRSDFVPPNLPLLSRSPSPLIASEQIRFALQTIQLPTKSVDLNSLDIIFLATDASDSEVAELEAHLKPLRVLRFCPTPDQWIEIGPGGVAIVDQWICAHAMLFIGTSPSTFTFRIAEERSIMGFSPASTFNTLCPSGLPKLYGQPASDHLDTGPEKQILLEQEGAFSACEPLTAWPVVYEPKFTLSHQNNNKNHNFKRMHIEL